MVELTNKEISIGSSIFWILLALILVVGLTFLSIWSFHNDSIKGIVIAFIFFAMAVSGILFSKFEIFNMGTWSENCISFVAGFGIWSIFSGILGTQSILSVSKNYLFATISGELPQVIDVTMNAFIVPIAEEMFWMFAIPYALISIMNQIGKKYDWANNSIIQILVVAVMASLSFAMFHVGKEALTVFLISAIIFRSIMIFIVFGESKFDYLQKFNLVASFSVGAHIANNLLQGGFKIAMTVIQTEPIIYWTIIGFALLMIATVLNKLFSYFFNKSDKSPQI